MFMSLLQMKLTRLILCTAEFQVLPMNIFHQAFSSCTNDMAYPASHGQMKLPELLSKVKPTDLSKNTIPKKNCGSKTKISKRNALNQTQTVFLIFLGISALSVGFLIMETGSQNLSSLGSNLDRKNSPHKANLEMKHAIDKYLKSEASGKNLASAAELLRVRTCVNELEHEIPNSIQFQYSYGVSEVLASGETRRRTNRSRRRKMSF